MQPKYTNYGALKEVQRQRYEKVSKACPCAWAAGSVFYQVKNVDLDNKGLDAHKTNNLII